MSKLRRGLIYIIWIALGGLVALVLLSLDSRRLQVTQYTLSSKKVSAPLRLALLTDLHSCKYGTGQEKLLEAINEAKPDALLFVGDICDDVQPHENTETLLKAVASRYPCYYVTGNHEYWGCEITKILEIFRRYGVKILEGEAEPLEIRGQKLLIAGVSDPDVEYYVPEAPTFKAQLSKAGRAAEDASSGADTFTILLSHRPERIGYYYAYPFDLVLSGHAHGGQWRLPGVRNGLFAPNQGFFPKYTSGVYDFGRTKMIVSCGLAKESTRIPRLFNRPEIVIVELSS